MVSESSCPLVEVRGLGLSRGGRRVLADINFSIARGETIAIIGPNGAGKSSLMLALLGLLPADAGCVRLDGRYMAGWRNRRALARLIAYVPQHYEGFTGFSVYDMVAAGRYAYHSPFAVHTQTDRRIICEAMEACGISELADRLVSHLSGGERQKTWLAAAIAQQSEALFLDEPTTALDPRHQSDLVLRLRELQRAGRTVVLICHDLNLAAALDARILALARGTLVHDEPVGRFLETDHITRVFDTQFEKLAAGGGTRVLIRI